MNHLIPSKQQQQFRKQFKKQLYNFKTKFIPTSNNNNQKNLKPAQLDPQAAVATTLPTNRRQYTK
jgi:hypothetical protein